MIDHRPLSGCSRDLRVADDSFRPAKKMMRQIQIDPRPRPKGIVVRQEKEAFQGRFRVSGRPHKDVAIGSTKGDDLDGPLLRVVRGGCSRCRRSALISLWTARESFHLGPRFKIAEHQEKRRPRIRLQCTSEPLLTKSSNTFTKTFDDSNTTDPSRTRYTSSGNTYQGCWLSPPRNRFRRCASFSSVRLFFACEPPTDNYRGPLCLYALDSTLVCLQRQLNRGRPMDHVLHV